MAPFLSAVSGIFGIYSRCFESCGCFLKALPDGELGPVLDSHAVARAQSFLNQARPVVHPGMASGILAKPILRSGPDHDAAWRCSRCGRREARRVNRFRHRAQIPIPGVGHQHPRNLAPGTAQHLDKPFGAGAFGTSTAPSNRAHVAVPMCSHLIPRPLFGVAPSGSHALCQWLCRHPSSWCDLRGWWAGEPAPAKAFVNCGG